MIGVVTQPDRPKGRELRVASAPVKEVAEGQLPGIPILQSAKASEPEFMDRLAGLGADLYVVVAFGQILPQKLLDIPRLGCINVHASLLPKYRGAAPIQRCLLNGEKETGVSIQKMVKQLDAGDIIAEARVAIPPEMTYGELEQALCETAKPLLLSVLEAYSRGVVAAAAQDFDQVTYAPKVEPEAGEIHWEKGAQELHNLIRAFNPRPGAWCWVDMGSGKKRLKVHRAVCVDQQGVPGSILSRKECIVACGSGALKLLEVQPEGKPRMPAADWLRGCSSSLHF